MDKRIVLAVAGAGKTTLLLNKLNKNERFLIVTYTKANYENIKKEIINKFSYIPSNIKLYTYFMFLYNFCFKPFEVNLSTNRNIRTRGLDFKTKDNEHKYNENQIAYYMGSQSKKMYSSRLSKLCNKEKMFNKVKRRIEKYFDYFFIDEVQDFAGNDFNFINNLINCNVNIFYVGDFYQHTFDTSRDGNLNSGLYADFNKYVNRIKNNHDDLCVDLHSLEKSMRCKEKVCEFIRNNLDIKIYGNEDKDVILTEVIDTNEICKIMNNDNIIKLFYQNSGKYKAKTENWGNCKGLTYNEVCVILNPKTYKLFNKNELNKLSMSTRNKLYVACTRTRNNLYFIAENNIKQYKIN